MLENIKAGKYEGIISWHPNRLSRNMKEAGEIIDLLDKFVIKSLQFPEMHFENNENGKMLLGIFFVMSKQYSDHLHAVVKRGNEMRLREGKWIGKPKHGYIKDVNQYLRPDGENFNLIKKAWFMRMEKVGFNEIAKFLNDNGYKKSQKYGDPHIPFEWNKQRLSDLFKDPIYAGVGVYGEEIISLEELFDFTPMISADEFLNLNNISSLKKLVHSKFVAPRGKVKANFLNGMITCDHCKESFSAGLTSKETSEGKVNYFYFRCETPRCTMKNKSIRGHVIADFVYKFLDEHPFGHEEGYKVYREEMKALNKQKLKELDSELRSVKIQLSQTEKRIEETKDFLRVEKDDIVKRMFSDDLKKYEKDTIALQGRIKKAKEEMANQKDGILTYEEFLELFKDFGFFLRDIEVLEDKDFFIRKIFSNFALRGKEMASFSLNKPFDTLFKCEEVLNGSEHRNGYFLITIRATLKRPSEFQGYSTFELWETPLNQERQDVCPASPVCQ